MSPMQMKEAQLEAVKQWRLDVQAGPERDAGGKRNYTPKKRNVAILRFVKNLDGSGTDDPDGLHKMLKSIINHPQFEQRTEGWDRCLTQHTPEGVYEWIIMDQSSAFAPLWSNAERAIVARSVANTYIRI